MHGLHDAARGDGGDRDRHAAHVRAVREDAGSPAGHQRLRGLRAALRGGMRRRRGGAGVPVPRHGERSGELFWRPAGPPETSGGGGVDGGDVSHVPQSGDQAGGVESDAGEVYRSVEQRALKRPLGSLEIVGQVAEV